MACEPQVYDSVTPIIFNCLKEKLKIAGYPIDGNEGTVKGPFGIKMDYKWNESESRLTVHVTEKSMFVSCDQISRIILDNLMDCGLMKQ